MLMAVSKLGFVANFLSKPIGAGFVGGLALDILASQVAKMLGISLEPGSEFVEKLIGIVSGLSTANLFSIALSAASILVLLGGRASSPAIDVLDGETIYPTDRAAVAALAS